MLVGMAVDRECSSTPIDPATMIAISIRQESRVERKLSGILRMASRIHQRIIDISPYGKSLAPTDP